VRDHFSRVAELGLLQSDARGIDVGTGPNLYPALTMLPFCGEVTLFEHSRNNIKWLEKEQGAGWPSWDVTWKQFWQVLRRRRAYRKIGKPEEAKEALAAKTRIEKGSVYELASQGQYHIGTMFFVAESITAEEAEFRSAIDHFLGALAPGAPFAIAFMEHSAGYKVGDHDFPATDIDARKVSDCLRDQVENISIKHVGRGLNPVRKGYTGMLIALGRVNESTDKSTEGATAHHEVAAAPADPGRLEGRGSLLPAGGHVEVGRGAAQLHQ
jgi:hypothetical protein